MIKVPKGWRRLGGNDIVREGDVEWFKDYNTPFTGENGNQTHGVLVTKSSWCLGEQMCTEDMYNYGNAIYRKLKPKNVTAEQTTP
jgi:hypothetical protein